MNIPSRIFAGLLAALFAPTLFCLPSSATDADLLKRHPTVFKRDKGMLIIQLKNGSPALSRKDDLTPGLTYIRTSIEEYEPKRDLVLLRETYYEGGAYKLISLRSGTELKLPAKPVWSPDKIFFAVTNDDESDYTENVLRIGICSPTECKKLYEREGRWGDTKWRGSSLVTTELRTYNNINGELESKKIVECQVKTESALCTEK